MNQQFDYNTFIVRSLAVVLHAEGKSYSQLLEEIEVIRQEYAGIRDKNARSVIRRRLNRMMLIAAMDTSQPTTSVDHLYRRVVRQGFNDLSERVTATIEYAGYCSDHGEPAKGMRALQKAVDAVQTTAEITPALAKNCLRALTKMIRQLEET